VKTLSMVLLLTALLAIHNLCAGQAIQFHEDFSGQGNLQTDSNYNGIKSGVLTRNATSISFGQILTLSKTFTGLKTKGVSNYYVTTPIHSMRISDSKDLNATAKILSTMEEGNLTQSTYYTAQGEGNVRERVLSQGMFGRPLDLSSLYHAGKFQLNSTTDKGGEE